MACEKCEESHGLNGVYPIRVGSKEIGWGTVLVKACEQHAQYVIGALREKAERDN